MRKIAIVAPGSGGYERSDLFTGDYANDVSLLPHAEDHHRHIVVAAQRYSGRVHHAKIPAENLGIGDLFETSGGAIFLWIGGVDTVDRSGLQKDVGPDLHRSQGCCSIRGEVRISGSSGEDHNASFFEVADRPAADIRLGDLMHLDGAHDAAVEASFFDGILERDGIDDGREHSHVIGRDAVHVDGLLGDSAKEVSPSNDDPDLAAEGVGGCNLFGYFVDKYGVDTEAAACRQGFS